MNRSTYNHSLVVKIIALASLILAFSAQADLKIQSAQYNAEKGTMHVKGKLSGNSVPEIYVFDAKSGLYIGSLATYASGRQFNSEMVMSRDYFVPCTVRVQTNNPFERRDRRRSVLSNSEGDEDKSAVRHAPDNCSFGR